VNPILNNNHSNNAFQKELQYCKQWLATRIQDTLGFSRDVVIDRLLQRVTELAIKPYVSTIVACCNHGAMKLPVKGRIMNCDRVMFKLGSGKIYLTPKQWLVNQIEFVGHWMFCLFSILNVKNIRDNEQPVVLVYGIGDETIFSGNNDSQFVEYCRSGPIEPLNKGRNYFIETSSKCISTADPEFKYCTRPLINLLRNSRLGIVARLRLLVSHFWLLFTYLHETIKFPQLSLIGKDIAYCRISSVLDKRCQIDSIVLTCSQYLRQPIWLRSLANAEVHMIWYAQSWKPTIYASDKIESDVPSLQWIRVDTHWVWTNAFSDYLKSLGISEKVEVVGPIVWYLPKLKKPTDTGIQIAIFDVSPFSNDVALEFGQVTNYHHPDNLFAFINDILYARERIQKSLNIPIKLLLKTKRGYKSVYDKMYFDYLDKLSASGEITLMDPGENMYSLISSSHLVFAYPFTSPAYIADSLKVPSIIYDPTNEIVRHDYGDSESLINFAGGREALISVAISLLDRNYTVEYVENNKASLVLDDINLNKGSSN